MKDYRLNVRFHMEDERERQAAEFLKGMPHGRNRFIVEAVLARMSDDRLMESIRQIFREEMQSLPAVAMPEPLFSSVDEEMTEEQREENRKNVLSDLDLFG